jgi:hypothetical protein
MFFFSLWQVLHYSACEPSLPLAHRRVIAAGCVGADERRRRGAIAGWWRSPAGWSVQQRARHGGYSGDVLARR